MFAGCKSLRSLDLSGWDVSGAKSMADMLCDCGSLSSLGLSGWRASSSTPLSAMFGSDAYPSWAGPKVSSLDLSGCTAADARLVLAGLRSGGSPGALRSLSLGGVDASGAADLSETFKGLSGLTSLDVSGWDVSSATSLASMFEGCSSLESLDLSGWDVSSATSLASMFRGCSSLGSIALPSWLSLIHI